MVAAAGIGAGLSREETKISRSPQGGCDRTRFQKHSGRSRETTMHGQNHPSEQPLHLAPALTAVILGFVAMAAFGATPGLWNIARSRRIAADEAIIDPGGANCTRLKNQGTALQQAAFEAGGLLPLYGSSELNMLRDLQSALPSDQPVPRSPYRIRGLPRGQAGDDLPDHPAEAGRGRPRAAGAESGGLPVAVLVLRPAHGLGRPATPAISPPCTPANWPSIPV